jgi:hypothetical protein
MLPPAPAPAELPDPPLEEPAPAGKVIVNFSETQKALTTFLHSMLYNVRISMARG